ETYFEDSEEAEGDTKKKSKFKTLFVIIFPLTLITGYLFREDLLSVDGQKVYTMLIAMVVYYGLMINAILPVYGIYFWVKYPSYRIESIEQRPSQNNVTKKKVRKKKGRKRKK